MTAIRRAKMKAEQKAKDDSRKECNRKDSVFVYEDGAGVKAFVDGVASDEYIRFLEWYMWEGIDCRNEMLKEYKKRKELESILLPRIEELERRAKMNHEELDALEAKVRKYKGEI